MQQEQIDLGHKRNMSSLWCEVLRLLPRRARLSANVVSQQRAINITKPKRGRKAGVSVATPTKTDKENDELKDLIEETEDTETQSEDTDNLAEDISIDIPTDKNEEETNQFIFYLKFLRFLLRLPQILNLKISQILQYISQKLLGTSDAHYTIAPFDHLS